MSKRMPYTAYTVYSGCSWNKFGLISAAIHQEPWEFSFEEFSQIIGKVVGYIIYKQGSSIFHLHVATCTIYVFAAVKRFWATSTPINYSKCDVQRQISSVNVCRATPIYQEAGKYYKTSKIWQNVCLILHWYPTWMATAPSNRPIKMVVQIQHLQCLSKDDKDHEDNPTGWWWMFWFPSEKKTNRQGTALTDNHCMHWEHPRKEQRAERRAPIGRVRQKKMAAGSERSRKNDRSLCGRQFSNVQSFECCKPQTRSKNQKGGPELELEWAGATT